LSQIFINIQIRIIKFLLSKFSYLAFLEALLVLEKAVRAAEEAVEGDNLLEESELRVGLFADFIFNCLLDRRLDLRVDLLSG